MSSNIKTLSGAVLENSKVRFAVSGCLMMALPVDEQLQVLRIVLWWWAQAFFPYKGVKEYDYKRVSAKGKDSNSNYGTHWSLGQ